MVRTYEPENKIIKNSSYVGILQYLDFLGNYDYKI